MEMTASAIVMVPLRAAPPLRATWTATLPLPAPLAADEIVIHPELLVAIHEQPSGAVTAMVPSPPPAANCGRLIAAWT
jgi:hypothetical protein